jgi:adenine deaminase
VICRGAPVTPGTERPAVDNPFDASVHVPTDLAGLATWRVDLPDGDHTFRALRVNPVDTYTAPDEIVLPVRDGVVGWEGRCAVVTVLERHSGAGKGQTAPVLGFDLEPGAFATTYAHDSHNLTVIATSSVALEEAARRVVSFGGGISVVRDGADPVDLPLPVGGVMSTGRAVDVAAAARAVRAAVQEWGWRHANPFMSLTTLALPVSPEVKITDRGLVRVVRRDWEPEVVEGTRHCTSGTLVQ